jgi:hypothetical protein
MGKGGEVYVRVGTADGLLCTSWTLIGMQFKSAMAPKHSASMEARPKAGPQTCSLGTKGSGAAMIDRGTGLATAKPW